MAGTVLEDNYLLLTQDPRFGSQAASSKGADVRYPSTHFPQQLA
jgi:hypothetical protein